MLESVATIVPTGARAPWRGKSGCPEYFVKYRELSLLDRIRRPFGNAFERSLELGIALERRGIRVGTPLAILRGPGRFGPGRWLYMDAISGEELGEAILSLGDSARATLFHHLAQVIAHLHDAGFRQRDLKAPNILIDEESNPVLVDLEGMRNLGRRAPRHLRIKDLARLAASFQSEGFVRAGVVVEEWEKLLSTYLMTTVDSDLDSFSFREQVTRLASEKAEWNARKGRILS